MFHVCLLSRNNLRTNCKAKFHPQQTGIRFAPPTPWTVEIVGDPPVPGLTVSLVTTALNANQPSTKFGVAACPGPPKVPATCEYSLLFQLTTKVPNNGVQAAPMAVNFKESGVVRSTVVFTVNLNCAPVFQSITASVGSSPGFANPVTYSIGNGGILYHKFPISRPVPAGAAVWAPNPGRLATYMVNFYMPKSFGDSGATATGATGSHKVFVNCRAAADAAQADRFMGGSTVLGIVKVKSTKEKQNSSVRGILRLSGHFFLPLVLKLFLGVQGNTFDTFHCLSRYRSLTQHSNDFGN